MAEYRVNKAYKFINPYNFISLGENEPERTEYAKGNLTGCITIKLETKSSLFIPNITSNKAFSYEHTAKDEKNDDPENEHQLFDFFSVTALDDKEKYDNQYFEPVIPGSEMRGMIRSIYETLTDSCISQINGDIFVGKRTFECFKPGVLMRSGMKIILYDAKDTIYRDPDNLMKKMYRDSLLSGKDGTKVNVSLKSKTEKGRSEVENFDGTKSGYLMLGEDGPEMQKKTAEKHCAHVFIPENNGKIWAIDENMLNRLGMVINQYQAENKKAYADYQKAYNAFKNCKSEGLPVYYSVINEENIFLSPACITREVYKNHPKDVIKNYGSCQKKAQKMLCPACKMFGLISQNGLTKGSDIRFSDMRVAEVKSDNKEYYDEELYTMPILSQPQLANTEFYLKKPRDLEGDVWFWTYDYYTVKKSDGNVIVKTYTPEISGRKFYWNGKKVESYYHKTRFNKTVRTVKEGISFHGKVYFENLTDTQLRQLCYILNYTCDGKHGYKLGGGKPIGLGTVCISVSEVKIREFKDGDYAERPYVFSKQESWEDMNFYGNNKRAFECMTEILPEEEAVLVRYPGVEKEGDEGFAWFADNKYYHKSRKLRTQTEIICTLPHPYEEKTMMMSTRKNDSDCANKAAVKKDVPIAEHGFSKGKKYSAVVTGTYKDWAYIELINDNGRKEKYTCSFYKGSKEIKIDTEVTVEYERSRKYNNKIIYQFKCCK